MLTLKSYKFSNNTEATQPLNHKAVTLPHHQPAALIPSKANLPTPRALHIQHKDMINPVTLTANNNPVAIPLKADTHQPDNTANPPTIPTHHLDNPANVVLALPSSAPVPVPSLVTKLVAVP